MFQIANQGYKVEFYKDKCLIKDINDNYKVVASRFIENELYRFGRFTSNGKALVAQTNNVIRLWHERMRHLNCKSLCLMKKFEMVYGLHNFFQEQEACEGCMCGKKHMEKFVKGKSWRAKTPLHLVHSDLMGPLEHPSISGLRYVLTFIDDYSRKIWVYFLK